MEPVEQKNLTKKFPDKEFNLNFYSWILTFFLCIVWPAGIIIMFYFGGRSGDYSEYNPVLRFYLPTIGTQLLILTGIYIVLSKEKAGLKSIAMERFRIVYIIDAVLFQLLAWYILSLVSSLLVRLDFIKFYDISPYFPRGDFDLVLWVLLSMVAAVTEETAFRGYLLSRLTRISNSRIAAVFIATLSFSAGHLYQGTGGFVLIFVYGLMFALLFFITRSLWPCIIAHFIHNAAAPILMRFINPQ